MTPRAQFAPVVSPYAIENPRDASCDCAGMAAIELRPARKTTRVRA